MDEIAREAGVSKATVYKYYKNKREIFYEVVQIESDQMLLHIREAVDKETTILGKLKAHFLTKIRTIHRLINFYRVTCDTWSAHWPFISDILENFMQEEKKLVRNILKQGNDSGELKVRDVAVAAHLIVVSMKSLEYPWAVEGQNFSPRKSLTASNLVDAMLDIHMNGLQKR